MRKTNLEQKELIYKLYFENKLTVTKISQEVDISISQVSRILSKSSLYNVEKANRKKENRIQHNEQAKQIMKKKRQQRKLEEKAIMDKLHYQAAIELSYYHPISLVNLRKNCSSAYNYNRERQRFELKDDVAYSKDMPTQIKY